MNSEINSYLRKRLIAGILLISVLIMLILITYVDINYEKDKKSQNNNVKGENDEIINDDNNMTFLTFTSTSISYMYDSKQLIFKQSVLGTKENSGLTAEYFNDYSFPSPIIDTGIYKNVESIGLLETDESVLLIALMKDNNNIPNYKIYGGNLLKSELLKSNDEVSSYILDNINQLDININISSIGKIYYKNKIYIGFKSNEDLYIFDDSMIPYKVN